MNLIKNIKYTLGVTCLECLHVCVYIYLILYLFISKNTEALVIASTEIGLVVDAEKTKYMVMSRDQNQEQNKTQTGNKSFETVKQYKR
jgi:hypothetical protein